MLGDHLKKWADPWIPYIGEDKGGAIPPDPDVFIVTSNWAPHEIWTEPQTLEPILRRFTVLQLEVNPNLYAPGNVNWYKITDVKMTREKFFGSGSAPE